MLLSGVHSVLVTPFSPAETVDERSIETLIDYCAEAGVAGVLVLGVLGEADRLSDVEREQVIDAAIMHARGRIQVTVGVTHQASVVAAARARFAARAGASAVMASPPVGSSVGPALRDYFRRIADGLDVPLVVQDHPASSGVHMPAAFLAELAKELPPGAAVKLEAPPTSAKIAALVKVVQQLQVFGGLGGVSLLQELGAGASGTMTGFALPDLLVRIVEAYGACDAERAQRIFERALPLMIFEAQPVIGLGVRKEILRRQGAISSATLRSPTAVLDELTLASLDELLNVTRAAR
jgi:4-hydroxy-tetrahydrodipicolinate synthase